MPSPKDNETREEFIKRCMEDVYDEWTGDPDETWDEERAYAYCINLWEDKEESSLKELILNYFNRE